MLTDVMLKKGYKLRVWEDESEEEGESNLLKRVDIGGNKKYIQNFGRTIS